MRYVFDHDYHIHSQISLCSQHPEQTNERILEYAKENKLKKICLTDHYWDENADGGYTDFYKTQNFAHISKALPLPQADSIEFMFGCETDMDKLLTVGISPENYDKFKFIIIPTTHLHMVGFTISEEQAATAAGRADAWIKRLEALLNMNLPFHKIGIAHLTCGLIAPDRKQFLEVLNLLPTDKLEELFSKAAALGVGIELNQDDMKFSDPEADTVLRIYRTAKQMGCKFYLGSDAHTPKSLNGTKAIFERAIDLLQLTEDDKFHIK